MYLHILNKNGNACTANDFLNYPGVKQDRKSPLNILLELFLRAGNNDYFCSQKERKHSVLVFSFIVPEQSYLLLYVAKYRVTKYF